MRQANLAGGSAIAIVKEMAVRTLGAEQEPQAVASNCRRGSFSDFVATPCRHTI